MTYKKVLYWIPALLWMGMIFYLSHQPAQASSSLSSGVMDWVLALLPSGLSFDINILHIFIRKSAHFSVYLVLAILICFAMYKGKIQGHQDSHCGRNHRVSSKRRLRSLQWYGIVLGVCFLYALSDEFHQTFISGRSGEFRDVLIDTSGALIGLLIFDILYRLIQRKRGHKLINKTK